jgi:type III secretion system needle length determinant
LFDRLRAGRDETFQDRAPGRQGAPGSCPADRAARDGQGPNGPSGLESEKNQAAEKSGRNASGEEDSLSVFISQALGALVPSSPAEAGAGKAEALTDAMASQDNADLTEKLLSRILVSEPGAAGHEVRLTVAPSILAKTEIRLSRGTDGFLNVTVIAGDSASLQTLVQGRADLERALSRTEGAGFRLDLSDGREEDNPERRSRGLMGADENE